jgi:hypothetical protein
MWHMPEPISLAGRWKVSYVAWLQRDPTHVVGSTAQVIQGSSSVTVVNDWAKDIPGAPWLWRFEGELKRNVTLEAKVHYAKRHGRFWEWASITLDSEDKLAFQEDPGDITRYERDVAVATLPTDAQIQFASCSALQKLASDLTAALGPWPVDFDSARKYFRETLHAIESELISHDEERRLIDIWQSSRTATPAEKHDAEIKLMEQRRVLRRRIEFLNQSLWAAEVQTKLNAINHEICDRCTKSHPLAWPPHENLVTEILKLLGG